MMRTRRLAWCMLAALMPAAAWAQTSFTYQGRLDGPGGPVDGTVSLRFTLLDAAVDGTIVAGPVVVEDTTVANGLLSVELDFGAAFDGGPRFLQVEVDGDGGTDAFEALAPRVAILPVPMALHAQEAATAADGWKLGGNAGTTPGTDVLGTTDGAALTLVSGGAAALRLVPTGAGGIFGGPSLVAHPSLNNAGSFRGLTLLGGGTVFGDALPNTATGDLATIGGGAGNSAGEAATISGGVENSAPGSQSSVGGGAANTASGFISVVGGGAGNTASGEAASVGGGNGNSAAALLATVAGGQTNSASGQRATVGGGLQNTAGGLHATVAGGRANRATGEASTAPGGEENRAGGAHSLAAGYKAIVRDAAASGDANGDEGTFVWNDRSGEAFTSTGPNQFLVGAAGGVGVNTNAPTAALTIGDTGNPFFDGVRFADGTLQTTAFAGSVEDADADPENELQDLSVTSDGTLRTIGITNGDGIVIDVADGDSSATNELNSAFVLDGTMLELTDAGGTLGVDLAPVLGEPSSLGAPDGAPAGVVAVDNEGNISISKTDGLVAVDAVADVSLAGVESLAISVPASGVGSLSALELVQSFTPEEDGLLVAAEVFSFGAAPTGVAVQVLLLEGANFSIADVQSARVITSCSLFSNGGWLRCDFGKPAYLEAGQAYTLYVADPFPNTQVEFMLVPGNPYVAGESRVPGFDHAFRTYMTEGGDLDASGVVSLGQTLSITDRGRVAINREQADHPLHVGLNATNGNGAHLTAGGTWTNASSRAFKTNFQALDPREVLRLVAGLPVTRWEYAGSDEGTHIGPMAEDFHAAFQTGGDPRAISTVDASGVALAAIQGLDAVVQEKSREIEELRRRNAELEERLARLEAALAKP